MAEKDRLTKIRTSDKAREVDLTDDQQTKLNLLGELLEKQFPGQGYCVSVFPTEKGGAATYLSNLPGKDAAVALLDIAALLGGTD